MILYDIINALDLANYANRNELETSELIMILPDSRSLQLA